MKSAHDASMMQEMQLNANVEIGCDKYLDRRRGMLENWYVGWMRRCIIASRAKVRCGRVGDASKQDVWKTRSGGQCIE